MALPSVVIDIANTDGNTGPSAPPITGIDANADGNAGPSAPPGQRGRVPWTAAPPLVDPDFVVNDEYYKALNQVPRPCSSTQVIGFKDRRMYKAAKEGNADFFNNIAVPGSISIRTTAGRTVLHIAAAEGHRVVVEAILQRCPELRETVDNAKNSALHLAASEGHLDVVMALLERLGEMVVSVSFILSRNLVGDTALDEALRKGRTGVAQLLAEKIIIRRELINISDACSCLYLAAVEGNLDFLKFWAEKKPNSFVDKIVHGALRSKNYSAAVLEFILRQLPRSEAPDEEVASSQLFDEEGRTPLSFAAYAGNSSAFFRLSSDFPKQVYRSDQTVDGFFPIHTAASRGHVEIVQEILYRFPESWELLTRRNQRNFIHAAAIYGKASVVKCVMGMKGFEKHVNERDEDGNTPLHLAAWFGQPKVVSILTRDKRVAVNVLNNYGCTALELSLQNSGASLSSRKVLTWAALKSAGATKSLHKNIFTPPDPKYESYYASIFKERVGNGNLLLVAVLIATVSYACGFTVPGGTDGPSGIAKLAQKPLFQTFLICDIIAMFSSVIAVVLLISAQLDDVALMNTALRTALSLLGVALAAMSLAFTTGMYLAVSHLMWLAVVVLAVGSFFTLFVVLLYLQACLMTLSSSNFILRLASYPTFRLMMWATRSDIDDCRDEYKATTVW